MKSNSPPSAVGATPFDPTAYWADLVRGRLTLDMVGNVGCGIAFNRWIYRRKWEALSSAMASRHVDLAGSSLFEAGFGIGFYLERWAALGVERVAGADLSPAAVAGASERFPSYDLKCADLAELSPAGPRYDVVVAIDVLYHIVDDARWEDALSGLAARVRDGGLLVFTDQFWPRRETRSPHVRRRTWSDYHDLLDAQGFTSHARHPFTRLLGHEGEGWSLAWGTWLTCYRAVRMAKRVGLGEGAGALLGRTLYALENRFPARPGRDSCLEVVVSRRTRDTI